MKYAVEFDSSVMKCVPGSISTDSGIQMLIGEIHRQEGDSISLL
jgi:hypothetical protein